jgi:predicted house-cleaning noncanonical NTP pyrophosphatase (MazG superfamily)
MNGLSLKIFHLDIVVSHLALEKKLDLMEKMFGEFSEFINSKKLNNLSIVLRINLGKN